MKKLCLNLLALCAVITGSVNVAPSQQASEALFNPPGWILGSWTTSAVSNLNDSETFTFTAGEITFEEGFDDLTVFNFSQKFNHYRVKETIEEKLYRVEFYRGKNELVYEFRPCETDLCKRTFSRQGLTYSIIRDKKVVWGHQTSINLVLFKDVK